jgi:hypothetical protein
MFSQPPKPQPSILKTWEQAAGVDPTLRVTRAHLRALRRRELRPVPFSRDLMFSSMQRGEPLLVDDLPVRVEGEQQWGVREAVLRALSGGFPRDRKVRVRCGPSGEQKSIVVEKLLRRWTSARARIHVTDMHIRGTRVLQRIDCSTLSDFNLLAETRGAISAQEMLTMVVSSAGVRSDSHTDDPDGSNHCFVGRKLWLVWDTFLGLRRDLEDVSRCKITSDSARFSTDAFLSVPGSHWFTIEPGQTLFLPGHLTHKVITLDDYLGVGSFFVMLPSYLRTLVRWSRHTPLWALEGPQERRLDLVDQITRRVTSKMRELRAAPHEERCRWGIAHLQSAIEEWQRNSPAKATRELLGNPVSAGFVRSATLDE